MEVLTRDRREFVGSSDAPAIMGVSKWATPLDCYIEKTEGPSAEREAQNIKAKQRGKRLEPYVVDMARAEHGLTVSARNKIYFDIQHPFLRCEVDFETDDPTETCEVKTVDVRAAAAWGEENTDEVPIYYQAQALHSLMVTGRQRCRFFALIGFDLVPYVIERDEEIIAGMRAKEVEFWTEHVGKKRPPAPITSSDVLRLFAKDTGAQVEADVETFAAVERLRLLKAHAPEIKDLEERIKVAIGGASTLTFKGKILATYKEQSGGVHWQSSILDEKYPMLAGECKKERRFRVLRVKA